MAKPLVNLERGERLRTFIEGAEAILDEPPKEEAPIPKPRPRGPAPHAPKPKAKPVEAPKAVARAPRPVPKPEPKPAPKPKAEGVEPVKPGTTHRFGDPVVGKHPKYGSVMKGPRGATYVVIKGIRYYGDYAK